MLIHTCCADCLIKFYQTLDEKQKSTSQIFFYNPNIYPREEYVARLLAIKTIAKQFNINSKIIVPNYLPQDYFKNLSQLSSNREIREKKKEQNCFTIISQKKRCPLCWELRLRALFERAKSDKIQVVSSTLFSSNYQNLSQIKQIAQKLSQEFNIDFYFPQISQTNRQQINKGFYKQNYCGCLYSLIEKSREKYQI